METEACSGNDRDACQGVHGASAVMLLRKLPAAPSPRPRPRRSSSLDGSVRSAGPAARERTCRRELQRAWGPRLSDIVWARLPAPLEWSADLLTSDLHTQWV